MKKNIIFVFSFLLSAMFLFGCSGNLDNNITFENISASNLKINFRGSDINVPSGRTIVLKAVHPGTYTYATTYSVPLAFTNATTDGDVSGSVIMNASTKIRIIFSSFASKTTYTLSATISNSDDQNASNPTSP